MRSLKHKIFEFTEKLRKIGFVKYYLEIEGEEKLIELRSALDC